MPPAAGSVKVPTRGTWAGLVIAAVALWFLRGYVWPVLSNVEVDTLRAMLDPTLFRRDFSVQESLGFGPRFYYNQLVLLPARAGLPLAWSFALCHVAALVALLAGVRSLARSAGLTEGATAILVLWLLTAAIGTLGGTYIYTGAPVPAVWAIALAGVGAAQAARGKWLPAFAWLGGATLLQFLVGFYAGVIVLGMLLWTQRGRGLVATLPWLAGLALVYGPMAATGGTSSNALDAAGFVHVYAQLRLPHHLVPSTWGWPVWVQAGLFYAGAGWLFWCTRAGRPAWELPLFAGIVALTVAGLVLNYLFVEIYPLPLVAKLQPARLTAFAQAITLLLLATRVQACFARRNWAGGVALAILPFTILPGALLLLAGVLLPEKERPSAAPGWILLLAVLLALQPFGAGLGFRAWRYAIWALIIGAQLLVFVRSWSPRLLQAAAVLALVAAGAVATASYSPRWPARLAGHFSIDVPPATAPGVLGWRFGRQSHPDALVLVPPTSETWSFKLYARRAVVVDDKGTPFTDRGMVEWRARMDQVLGAPLAPGLDASAAWRARSPDAIAATAAKYGARYVLTRDEDHPSLPGEVIDREGGWSLWMLPR